MACYHPLKGFIIGKTDQGRNNLIVTSARVDHIEIDGKGNIKKAFTRGIGSNTKLCVSDHVDIPCGQCIGCRLDYAREWADRCFLEMQQHKDNCFITLTYDKEHCPTKCKVYVDENGEFQPDPSGARNMTLVPEDMTKFIKKLRNHVNRRIVGFKEYKNGTKKPIYKYLKSSDPGYVNIRYYGCGEYGSVNCRPHMHICIFGWKPADLSQDFDVSMETKSELGYNYYRSRFVESCWTDKENNCKGLVVVADCNWDTCCYTARYVTKKLKGKEKVFYALNNIESEFVRMSRNPGIANNYIASHNSSYANLLHLYIPTETGSHQINNIRYFDDYLDKNHPYDLELLKQNRKEMNKFRDRLKQMKTSVPLLDLLEKEEEIFKQKTLILERRPC